jgi:hypothetical protein
MTKRFKLAFFMVILLGYMLGLIFNPVNLCYVIFDGGENPHFSRATFLIMYVSFGVCSASLTVGLWILCNAKGGDLDT